MPVRLLDRRSLVALALFIVLAVAHTWPLASAPGTLSRNDTADTVLHEWTLAWIAHQLPRDPVHLFDTNIFHPEKNTLAYSDHLFVQGVMAAPIIWAGGSPVLAYNLVLIAGFALTGWAACFLVMTWTESWWAGVLSGSLMAFNAFTLTRLPQLQDQHLEFFPLALLALDRLLERPRVRTALWLAGWYVLEALTCGYVLVFAFLSLAVSAAARPEQWAGHRFRAFLRPLAATAVVCAVTLVPFLLPYMRVSREQGLTRSLEEVGLYSAHVSDYLSTGGRFHFELWSQRFFKADALFPGIVGLGLALFSVASGTALRDRRARMALAFAVFTCCFSFGTAFPLYRVLYYGFPLMQGLRGAARFGQFFLIGVAILAGFGLADIQRRLKRGAMAVAITLVVAVNLEALRAPLVYRQFRGIPPIYDTLAEGRSLVAFFPFFNHSNFFGNARYMLYTTRSWQPMLNGYSGFAPPSFSRNADALAGFPDRAAIDYLRAQGVTHVVVDTNALSAPRLLMLPAVPELSLWKSDDTTDIYLLR